MPDHAFGSVGVNRPLITGPPGRLVPRQRAVEIYDEFINTTVSATAAAGNWLHTEVDTDSDGTGTFALSDAHGGSLTLTTDNNGADAQNISTAGEIYLFDATKRVYFEVTGQLDTNGITGALFAGFSEGVVAGVDNATFLAAANFGFSSIAGTVSFTFGGATSTTTATGNTLVAATDFTLACEYDGNGTYRAWQDGTLTNTSTVATTNPDANMALIISLENSAAANAKVLTLKNVYAYIEL